MANIDTRELSHDRTIAEAVFKKSAPGSTPGHQRAVTAVNERDIRDNAPTSVTESFTVSTHEIPSLDQIKVKIGQNIDGDKSTGAIIRNPEQTHRLDQANAAAELAHLVLEKGYADLTVGQKRQLQERVLPALMRLWPEFNTAFGTLSRRDRQIMMDDILADPQFGKELLGILKELQGDDKVVGSVDKSDFETKKETYEIKRLELTKLNGDYTQALADKEEFDPHHPKANELVLLPAASAIEIELQVKKTELKTLENEVTSLKERIDIYFRALNDARTTPELTRTRAEAADVTHGIDALRRRKTEIETRLLPSKQSEITTLDLAKTKRKELEEEQKEARKKERELLNQRDDLDRVVAKLNRDMLSAQADIGLGKLKRTTDEKIYVRAFQDSFARAAEAVVRTRITQKEGVRTALLKEISDQAKNGITKRWLNTDGTCNKDRIKADYQRMIDGHIDDVTKDMLVAQGGMQRAEVEQHKLVTDKAQADLLRTATATELMTRFIQSGGKMGKEDVRKLVNSDLGDTIIIKAVEANTTLKTAFDTALEKLNPKPAEGKAKGADRVKKIKALLKQIPKHKKQILMASLLVAGGYFAGPAILTALLPQIDKAALKWSAVAAKHQSVQSVADTITGLPHKIGGAFSVPIERVS